MKKVVKKAWPALSAPALVFVCGSMLLTACSKDPEPVAPAADTASAASSSNNAQPTGLVKDPVKHAHTADVTKWMDQASKKTPAQIAQEEKLAREAKEKQAADAKKAMESKAAAPKTATSAIKETVTPIPAPAQATPAPVQTAAAAPATKAPEVAPATAAPAPVAKAPEPEQNTSLKLLNRVQPKYPTMAARAGIAEGSVSARLHVEADGRVSQVEILKARPAKMFDKEVIAAASQWKYAPISKAQTTVAEFSFKLDQ